MTRPITLGDVLRAFRELGATSDGERRAIARLLGYDLTDATPEAPTPQPPGVPEPSPRVMTKPGEDHKPAIPDEPGAPVTELFRLPDIVRNPVELPEPIGRPEVATSPAAPAPPLLDPVWSPVILARLGARLASVGALDLSRLIPHIARRTPLRSLPRRLRLVTAPAITVVLDISGTMAWLAEDQAALVAQLRATLRAPIDVVTSDGPPMIAEPGAAAARGPGEDATQAGEAIEGIDEQPPAIRVEDGARVLAITDLGAGSSWTPPARERAVAWRAFARDLRAQGTSLVLLTPVPAARRPAEVRDLACVHWHRRTRPSQVHALVRQLR